VKFVSLPGPAIPGSTASMTTKTSRGLVSSTVGGSITAVATFSVQ
jgi:hypothetical protein